MGFPQAAFNQPDLQRINRCRLYLRVTMLSEICTEDGSKLLTDVWNGKMPSSYSQLLWPRQPRPSGLSWRIWRRFLTQALRPGHYTCYSTQLVLQQPLGKWFVGFTRERQWPWYYSPSSQVFLRYDILAKSYQGHTTHAHQHRIIGDIDPDFCRYDLPDDAVPCDPTVSEENVGIPVRQVFHLPVPHPTSANPSECPYTDQILPHPTQTPADNPLPAPSTWIEYYNRLPSWEASLLPTTIDSTVLRFVQTAHLQRTTIYHCSDGSSNDNRGSFGWTFGPNPTIILTHSGPAPGAPMDSYLAESYGLLSSSCFWFRITKLLLRRRPPRFRLRLYCDNKSLVRRVNEFAQFFDGSFRRSLTPNYDVVFLIACVLSQFPEGTVQVLHVKGHQDNNCPKHLLSWPSQLNIAADKAASIFLSQTSISPPTPFLPSAQIHLRDPQHVIVIKRWNIHLRKFYFRHQYRQWLCQQFNWTPTTLDDIDFDGYDLTAKCLPTHLQRFMIKWMNQSLPVRRRVHRYDRHIAPTCQLCTTTIECDEHFLQCPSTARRTACYDVYLRLHDHLQKLHTQPALHATILYLLARALGIPSCPPSQNLALTRQSLIGPMQFVKGRWSRTFRQTQEAFYRAQHRPITFNGDRWIQQTMGLLFEQIHAVWQCRNNQTHGADKLLQDQLQKEQLSTRIHALYNQRHNLLSHDRDILDNTDPTELLSGSIATIKTWLNMVEPTIQRCLKDAKTKLHHNQTDIRDFFDDVSYVDSHEDDTTLSFDTLGTSGSLHFQTSSDSTSSDNDSTTSSSESSGTPYSGVDGSP